MPTAPSTHQTSLKDKPLLRWGAAAAWALLAAYVAVVLGAAMLPQFSSMFSDGWMMTIFKLPRLFQNLLDYGVDLLLLFGFMATAGALFFYRSDDGFAIFTSAFLVAFGARITGAANSVAFTPGWEVLGGLVLALGDIGIVLFLMLFPDGKFSPSWMKYLAPPLVLSMAAVYAFPFAPFFWLKMGMIPTLAFLTAWYLLGLWAFSSRYARGTLAVKQQMRWVSAGSLSAFLWFAVFQLAPALFPALRGENLTALIFDVAARVFSIFLFLPLPLSIVISIVRNRLFDIDLIINRSLVYGILTAALGLTFALLFGLGTTIFRSMNQGDQPFVIAVIFAGAAGALFQPMRKKLQRFVDRAIYHIQIEYDKTPAEPSASSQTFITGATLSSYNNLKLIGRGGMAEVYRAVSPTQGRGVAIKVLKANLAGEEQFRRRFMREAEIVSGLEHPNIVRVLDYGHEGDAYYIVMELLSGPDLNFLLKEEKRFSLEKTVELLSGIASALDYAHQNGLIHRDVKPSNVMLDAPTNRVLLTDFGIAKISDAHTKITNTGMLGTFDYIAPEQIQASAEVDGRADVYALGVMTYQMLTGRLPFERPNTGALLLAHLNSPPPDARELLPDLPRETARALQKATAKIPEERFATAGEFIAQLGA